MDTTETTDTPPSGIEDERVGVSLVGDLLRRAREEGRFEVVRLTDEELTVLDGVDSAQVAPRPWFTTLDASTREVALAVALRGLAMRGLVGSSVIEDTSGDVSLELDDDVHATLVARRAASEIIIAHRRTQHASWSKVCYVQGSAGVVEEDVSPGGVHTLWAGPSESIVESVAAFADPEYAAAEDPGGDVREVPLGDVAAGTETIEPLDAHLVTVIVAVGLDTDGESIENRVSVHVGDAGVQVVRSMTGDKNVARLEPVSRAGLRTVVADVIGREERG
ncbi:hypothetical protein EF847_19550 [Actinobacteria bacterium YIM 96077]|uniref:ESX secretion-associated protein EspG n=1 Tax=Phytoactinopolyspora halophila TaxID=1981511 RepID=A0A329QNZ5_9ACTN|nr:hypothetical protein [Phytoactinopolyspora halophila]AYY14562.1 hypothetical protein EF847_19550 [Actinobacteria bacterium YIM 96077]RAW14060.1 hypothetical protein DPM12_11585 [Phytoactinopolyspora halophila]